MSETETLVRHVGRALSDLARPGAGILLAVSGGADSIGMLHLVHWHASELGLALAVGFVDHGLREGVDDEWALVSSAAERLDVSATRLDVRAAGAEQGGSLQQWARDARYRELEAAASRMGLGFVATAHTVDDQAETLLLRLARGTGIDGLGGIPPVRELGDSVRVIRPLLSVTRAEIRGFLEREGIAWAEDPSNDDRRFARVRVRKEVLPVLESIQPGIGARLGAIADEARGVSRFLEEYLSDGKFFDDIRLGSGVKVDSHVFERLPSSVWLRVVRVALKRVRGDLRRVERAHLAPVRELISTAGSGGPIALPGDAEIHVYRGALYAFPERLPGRPTGAGQPVAAGSGKWSVRFAALGAIAEIRSGARELVEDLEVRARLPGDKLLGSGTKLKDLLGERRVPRPYRDFVPVLALGDEIVACPSLVKCRREGVEVSWVFDDEAPLLDFDFPRITRS